MGESKDKLPKSFDVFRAYLDDVAEGRVQLSSEQAEVWSKYKESAPKAVPPAVQETVSHNGHAHQNAVGNFSSVDSFADSKPGEKLQIGNSVTAVKTENGGLEIIAGTRKLKFSSVEAEGAVQQIDLLKEAGAEFLIPAMKEIAVASDTQIKNGVGREESARILSVLSRAFGYDSVTKETDPKIMLEKFKNASS